MKKKYRILYLVPFFLAAIVLTPSWARRGQKADEQPAQALVGMSTTLMPDGSSLILGGQGKNGSVATAAIRDAAGVLTPLKQGLLQARAWHTAIVLPDGTVFIFGGIDAKDRLVTTAESFNPDTQVFTAVSTTGLTPRAHHTATLLTDGRLLITGGVSNTGGTLDSAELYDSKTLTGTNLPPGLLIARHDQTATLLPDGEVLLWGGVDSNGTALNFGELFDPATLRFTIEATPYQVSTDSPRLQDSIPSDQAENVAVDTLIALRFSKPLLVTTVNSTTVTLAGPSGAVPAKVIAAEGGMLAFVTPQEALLPGTPYVVTLMGLTDPSGSALTQTLVSFTTAGQSPDSALIPFGAGSSSSGNISFDPSSQRLPPLQARAGVTALAGQSLQLNGAPLKGVTLQVDDLNAKTKTDDTGRFLVQPISFGHHVLLVDASTASSKDQSYGIYEIGVDIIAGRTNALPYTIWMTALDTAHAVTIPSPTTGEVVVRNPQLPGLELHIPAGTVIKDHDGKVVKQITITPIPLNQPPFPLPAGVQVPIYFTIQPGAAYLEDSQGAYVGAQLYYPNTYHLPPGTRRDFWNYDADQNGWYIYGQGTVSPDGSQVIPDPGVKIYEFTGAMVNGGSPPAAGRPPGGPGGPGGDPVDLSTGLFIYNKTDLTVADTIPLALTRTYRPADSGSHAFGIGTTHPYDMYLIGDGSSYSYQEVILPDGGRIRYDRTSSGTNYTDAAFVHSSTRTMFYGSTIVWNGTSWTLTLKDGTQYVFPESSGATTPQAAAVVSMKDRNNNTVTFTRDSNHNLTQLTSPNGRWIKFTYDGSNRITQAQDNIGRTVSYTYDSGGRLSTVTDVNGGTTTYTYDSNNNMLTITDPRNITYLTNQYDSNNRVTLQTLADGTTYQFAWTLSSYSAQSHFVVTGGGYSGAGPGKDISGFRACSGCEEGYRPLVSQVDVTDQRGHVRRVVFGDTGYITSDTNAYGETGAQATTYQYTPDNLLQSTTDALSRTTAYTYDTNNNATQVTALSGTGNAVSTSFTYESTFNQLASVTDPLSHTTTFAHDSNGNVSSVTDPLSHATTFTYNSAGQSLTATDSLSHTTSFGYDGGDLVSTTDPLSHTTTRFLDGAGRLIAVTDPLNQSTRYSYDALDEVTGTTDAQGNVTTFTYDGNGSLLTVTDANSHTTSYVYDSMDRLAARTDALGNSESYTYDAGGNLTAFNDRRGKVTSYTYDNLGRRTFAGFGTTAGPTYDSSITYNYDAGNRYTSVVDSVAGTITPTFDGLDRLTSEVSPQGTVSYAYDAAGRRTSMTVTGQTALSYTYDNANRLTQITRGTPTVSLAYDNANRRSSVTLPNGIVMSYTYDNGSELTAITYTHSGTTLGDLSYTYDLAGRRASMGGSYAQTGLPLSVSNTVYNANNQLTQWGTTSLFYDENGNMISDGANNLAWSTRNQLASMNFGANSFQYDAYGRRTGKIISSATTNYLYDGANTIQELSGTTPTANLLTGLGIDERFTRTDSSWTANFLTDALGSSVALADGSAAVQTAYAYEPFGNSSVSGTSTPYQYTGRENDATGLYFYRARYYSPGLQRFISEDPIGPAGGLDEYAYAVGNPISGTDPTGLDTQFGIGVGITFFGLTVGGGGGGSIGISTNWTLSGTSLYTTEQVNVMGGAGLYGGVGLSPTVGRTNGPLTSTSGVWSGYGEADVGAGESAGVSASVPINPDGSLGWSSPSGSIGMPVKAFPGLGVGAAAGVGVSNSSTQVTPTLGQIWNSIVNSLNNSFSGRKR